MEEVDNIILHTLKQIDCEVPEEVCSLREFSVELVVRACVKCLHVITPQCNISPELPASMSARFRIGTTIAQACQELGYKGEIGYQTFLYANEQELRKVLLFLIEKLPKETSETADQPLGRAALLSQRVAAELKRQLSVPWLPPYCRKENLVKVGSAHWFFQGSKSFQHVSTENLKSPVGMSEPNKISKEKMNEYSSLPFVTSQPTFKNDIFASIVQMNSSLLEKEREKEQEWNMIGMSSNLSKEAYSKKKKEQVLKRVRKNMEGTVPNSSITSNKSNVALKDLLDTGKQPKKNKGSRFTHAEKLQHSKDEEKAIAEIKIKHEEVNSTETEEDKEKKREEEISCLQEQLSELSLNLHDTQLQIKQVTAQNSQVTDKVSKLEETNKTQESEYRVKKRTVDLLPDAKNNIVKLEELIESSSERLVTLNEQWENHRLPLINNCRDLKEKQKSRVSEIETKIAQVRSLREKMKQCSNETRGKEEILKQLVAEHEMMSKDVNRSSYTKRILEIVGNIKKQKEQIAKVLGDTRSIQKDINFLNGNLERTFTVTDELIYQNATKDEFSRKSYKMLASLHQSFAKLVETVEDTGSTMREIRDLEELVSGFNDSEVEQNLQRITQDLEQMRNENDQVVAKLKKAKKK